MCEQQYDVTYNDLNPTFLFTCKIKRTETEENYHCHEFAELSIITEGKGIYHIDGKDYPIQAGDLVILNPGTYHQSVAAFPASCTLEHYLAFTDFHIRGEPVNTLPLPDDKLVFSMSTEMKQEVFKICTAMAKEANTGHPGRYFMLKTYLIQIILLLLREQQGIVANEKGCYFKSTNKAYVVKQIIQYFNQHYQEKISLDQISQNMYLSPFYVSKIFKSETGESPINYLINLRMQKAMELVDEHPHMSIQDIASAVGYADVYHFSKLFKKHFGSAPSAYRKQVDLT